MGIDIKNSFVTKIEENGTVTRERPAPAAGEIRQFAEGAVEAHLGHLAQLNKAQQEAVKWQADQYLKSNGGDFAKNNPKKFLENAQESIAADSKLVERAGNKFKESPEYNKSVAQDVVGALVERGMINLKDIKAEASVGGDVAPQSKAELPDMKEQVSKNPKSREDHGSRGGR